MNKERNICIVGLGLLGGSYAMGLTDAGYTVTAVCGRHRSMESIGGEVIVRNPPQHIRRVMRLSGMERIARIQMDAPAAQPEEPAERRDEQ